MTILVTNLQLVIVVGIIWQFRLK